MIQKIVLLFLLTSSFTTYSQVGTYEFESQNLIERIALHEDSSFTYNYITQWAKGEVQGTWTRQGDMLYLNSNYQLSDFSVMESFIDTLHSQIKVIFDSPARKGGPSDIEKIYLNNRQDSLCEPNYPDLMRDLQHYQAVAQSNDAPRIDSLSQKYRRQYFVCPQALTRHIEVLFDGQHIEYYTQNEAANHFHFICNFAPDTRYRYFKNEAFKIERKALLATEQRIGKRQKPARYKKQ